MGGGLSHTLQAEDIIDRKWFYFMVILTQFQGQIKLENVKNQPKWTQKSIKMDGQKNGEFGLKPKHEWSKTVQIPSWVDINSIKVTLNEVKEKIVISGLKKNEENDLNAKDVIEVSDEEIDIELEEVLLE